MKRMSWFFIVLALLGGLSFYFSQSKRKSTQGDRIITATNQGDTIPKKKDNENVYNGLREMALNISPGELQLTMPDNQIKVYGILLDWHLGDGIATVICFLTGDASMYLSSGGGIIGAGKHEKVSRETKKLVENAQKYLDKAKKTDSTPLPDRNRVNFYFLTNKGKYFAAENILNFENRSSAWLPLFEEFNSVITGLRENEENNH
jgi:hypothetical protein